MELSQYSLVGTTAYLKIRQGEKFYYDLFTCISHGKVVATVKNNDGIKREVRMSYWSRVVRHSKGLI